ncbi:MAG TPA: helix-turn-helix domain-containing protein [Micromonosporaceae bacterium]|nr:helix-turn-helix domain-containing protein [Micromonosporaceae bacterium]
MLTVEQAAQRLGTPVRFIRCLVVERRIPYHKVGKYVYLYPDDDPATNSPSRPPLTANPSLRGRSIV